jgi:hypothetical protein
MLAGFLGNPPAGLAQYPSKSQITKDGTSVLVEDYVGLPRTRPRHDQGPKADSEGLQLQLARPNAVISEPPAAPQSTSRFFVVDQNGSLYILDKATKTLTAYIDFGTVFGKFADTGSYGGYGAGLSSIAFDPEYARNGKFYTVHTEDPTTPGSAVPINARLPGFNPNGFTTTPAINPPAGEVEFESVLVEWTDTNIRNAMFEGTAREVLRVGFNFFWHPMGDVLFNPVVRPSDADYRNLYISVGDGTAGERPGVTHATPQRLDALLGKILRITPDLTLRPNDKLSANGRYRIPSTGSNPNPFVSVNGARGEIFAHGFRNPHRLTWDPVTNTLLASDIGRGQWEEVNIITRGGNYGYAEREGQEQAFVGGPNSGRTGGQIEPPVPFPSPDTLVVDGLEKPVTPIYPAAAFSHRDGAAIGSGFVYRGKLMPALVGKYVFSDVVSGRLFYADLAEMLATRGLHGKLAEARELQVEYKSPYESAAQGAVKRRMFDIVADAYAHKQGAARQNYVLPGASGLTAAGQLDPYGVAYGGGRADVRLAMGGDGEIYLMCKGDGMIRKLVALVTPPPAPRQAGGR